MITKLLPLLILAFALPLPACGGDCMDLPGQPGQIFCLPDDNDEPPTSATAGNESDTDTADDTGNTVKPCYNVAAAPEPVLENVCLEHPWIRPECPQPLPLCIDVLEVLSGCPFMDTCIYSDCADALAVTPCGEPRPVECQPISDCFLSLGVPLQVGLPTVSFDPAK